MIFTYAIRTYIYIYIYIYIWLSFVFDHGLVDVPMSQRVDRIAAP